MLAPRLAPSEIWPQAQSLLRDNSYTHTYANSFKPTSLIPPVSQASGSKFLAIYSSPMSQETWVQSLGLEDLLEEETATHSSNLAWETPWTGEPGWLWGRKESDTTERLGTHTHASSALTRISQPAALHMTRVSPDSFLGLYLPSCLTAMLLRVIIHPQHPHSKHHQVFRTPHRNHWSKCSQVPGFPDGSVVNNPPVDTGHTGSMPSQRRPHMPMSN